ncbi:unknown [Crocosphaera subtropica ATCC 51142]|uniref:Uncharacterized protein n=1 Tax=Crocosphaera subtropica (strain ATCC 51142 / BH68) TaxID=43989 RepID=B1X1E4_CROS5|nr:unknown [Crocosphaera subtropica ATCC 51142]
MEINKNSKTKPKRVKVRLNFILFIYIVENLILFNLIKARLLLSITALATKVKEASEKLSRFVLTKSLTDLGRARSSTLTTQ